MNFTLSRETAFRRAYEIHRALQQSGGQCQVRWHKGYIVTYRYPAPHGHGVRGELIGIYSSSARLEWIETDFLEFAATLTQASNRTPDFECSV